MLQRKIKQYRKFSVMYFSCNIQNGIVFHVGNKIGRGIISRVQKCRYFFVLRDILRETATMTVIQICEDKLYMEKDLSVLEV